MSRTKDSDAFWFKLIINYPQWENNTVIAVVPLMNITGIYNYISLSISTMWRFRWRILRVKNMSLVGWLYQKKSLRTWKRSDEGKEYVNEALKSQKWPEKPRRG